MSKMKRYLCMALVMVFTLAFILAGCGAEQTKETAKSGTAVTDAAKPSETAARAPAVKLKWYYYDNPQADDDVVFEEVNKYLQEKINTTIDFNPLSYTDYSTKMSVVIASGEKYDICFTSNWLNDYLGNVMKGAFLPLDDMLKKDAPKIYENVPAYMWDAAKVNGKIYAVVNPQIVARTPFLATTVQIAKDYNFNADSFTPGDLSSLTPFIEKVFKDHPDYTTQTEVDSSQLGVIIGQDNLVSWDVPGAIDVYSSDLKVFNQFESTAFINAIKIIQDWSGKGYTNSKVRITQMDNPKDDPNAPKMLVKIAGAYQPGGDLTESVYEGYPCVTFPAGKPFVSTQSIIMTLEAISRTSENPDRALAALELFNTDSYAFNTLNYGIKGKHYDISSDGFRVPGPDQSKYNPSNAWELATTFMSTVGEGQPKDIWEQTKAMNDSAAKSPALGFSFNPEPVADQIAKCKAIVDPYKRGLDIGFYSMDQYNAMVSQLKAVGSEQIIQEVQKQLNAWKASK